MCLQCACFVRFITFSRFVLDFVYSSVSFVGFQTTSIWEPHLLLDHLLINVVFGFGGGGGNGAVLIGNAVCVCELRQFVHLRFENSVRAPPSTALPQPHSNNHQKSQIRSLTPPRNPKPQGFHKNGLQTPGCRKPGVWC